MATQADTTIEVEVHTAGDHDDEEDTSTKRERIMTQKGLTYTKQIKKKRIGQLSSALEKATDQIQELVDLDSEVKDVSNSYVKWVKLFDQFLSIDSEYKQLMDTDELQKYAEDWFMHRQQRFLAFKCDMETWFASHTTSSSHSSEHDNISARSGKSHHSQGSRRSSTVVSAVIEQQKKKAELSVKVDYLRKKRVLEEEKLRLKMAEEEMKLEEEIEISVAHDRVLEDAVDRSSASHSRSVLSASKMDAVGKDHMNERVCDMNKIGCVRSVVGMDSNNSDNNAIMTVVQNLNKPSSDLAQFGGNPLDYARFMRQFKSKVVANCTDPEEKLNFLEQYTTNEAHDIVTGYSYLDPEKGYEKASRTRLGWTVIRPKSCGFNVSNRADVVAIQDLENTRNLDILYRKSLQIDFPESGIEKPEHSVEDRKFLDMMSKSKNFVDGHYEFSLPFREPPDLSDNHSQALQRLNSLKRKFQTNPKFKADYTKFMTDILNKDFAEEVPANEINRCNGRVWYIPHHGIYHAKKPNKIRVVFDCSSKYRGISLNQLLLQGPDMINNLLGVLLRFRQEEVAVMSDIECMFYQVKVTPEDRDFLRFFWWPNGNMDQVPMQYRMKVHLFGATSSPSCANYALRQAVEDNQEYFEPDICDVVRHSFYVDDFLCSVATEEEAIHFMKEISFMCNLGGFHLTKWMSNKKTVLESVEEPERAQHVKDLSFDTFPSHRALGVHWDVETDSFGFQISALTCQPTRRGIISLVSSVYDPFGFAAPFVLSAKVILQEACRQGLEWDQELSSHELQKWNQWLNYLPKLVNLSVPRCVKPSLFGETISVQLHHFSDASEYGYGLTSYIRLVNEQSHIHCMMLISRSRVTPLKKMTIPRLELTAATVAVKMSQRLSEELKLDVRQVFWTDSMTVIRYIANETTRFHTFVANRVSMIRHSTTPEQWRYLESKANPADIASRGSTIDSLLEDDQWIHGPTFLSEPESEWPKQPEGVHILPEDAEVKHSSNVASVSLVMEPSFLIDRLMSRTSNWLKLKRIMAWILLAFRTLRRWVGQRRQFRDQIQKIETDPTIIESKLDHQMTQLKDHSKFKSQEDIQKICLPGDVLLRAETFLIRDAQRRHYSAEMHDLENLNNAAEGTKTGVKITSTLYRLDPFLRDGIIRVGGRLSRSSLPYSAKHQVLLPKQSTLTSVVLHYIHRKVGHMGKNAMTCELRKSFWIPQVGIAIKSILSRCVTCRRYRASTCTQQMSDLPVERVVPDKPPFAHTGMDYFGPILVRRGRVTVKRYGVIFTCFSSRAVHLEVAYSLDTSSCIDAIRRFLSRRGPVDSIRSDNGTNLVGAERELRESIQQWNQSQISQALQQRYIKWDFNPPSASHFGGVWERLIRSIRKVMYSLLHDQVLHLDDEALQTVFCEVESILNSRPITPVTNDVNDLDALTPNDLLLLRPNTSLPCGVFDSNDTYARRRWRQVQYLAGLFWSRWKIEYLHLLQTRQKWQRSSRNLAKGDIVLVIDQPRSAWMMGRVVAVTKDKKGQVRVVKIKTPTGELERPIHKLSLLLEAEKCDI